jgi:uncharacterized protein YhaN
MKFAKIRFEKIGPFDDTTLNFSKGKLGLHIVYGSNEAGKSSALKYIDWFLFGIPPQNDDNFTYSFSKFLIESTIIDKHQKTHILRRTKGNKNTLLDNNGSDASEVLRSILKGITSQNFSNLFGINHSQLRSGGRGFLEGKGDLSKLIFEAGTGLSGLNKILDSLRKNADIIYAPRKSSLPLNQLFENANTNLTSIQTSKLNQQDFQAALDKVNQLQDEFKISETSRRELLAKLSELQRSKRALPQLTKYKTAENVLKQNHSIPAIDEEALKEYRNAFNLHSKSRLSLTNQEEQVSGIEAKLELLNPNLLLLENQIEIESLNKSTELLEERLAHIPKLNEKKTIEETQALNLLKSFFPKNTLENADELSLDQNTRTKIQEQGQKIELLKGAIASSETNLVNKNDQIILLKSNLNDGGPHPQAIKIHAIITSVKANKLTPQDLEILLGDLPARIKKAENKLKSLPYVDLNSEQFLGTRLPTKDEIRDIANAFEINQKNEHAFLKDCQSREKILITKKSDLEKLRKASQNLSTETLIQIRAYRDLAWQEVENSLDGKLAVIPNAILQKIGTSKNIRDGFLYLQKQIDQVTDILLSEADLVGQANQLTKDILVLESELLQLKSQITATQTQKKLLDLEWSKRWEAINISNPVAPKDMLDWHSQAITIQEELIDLDVRLKIFNNNKERQILAFNDLIKITETEIGGEITAWIKAEEILQQEINKHADKHAHEKHLNLLLLEQQKINDEFGNKKIQLEGMLEIWSELMLNLKLEKNSSTNNANGHIAALDKIQSHLKDRADFTDRISKIELLNKSIQKRVVDVLEKISSFNFSTELNEITTTVSQLYIKLNATKHDFTKQKELEKELEEAKEILDKRKEQSRGDEEMLTPLAKMLGNIPIDNISQHFESIQIRNKATKDKEDAEITLMAEAQGKELAHFINELEEADFLALGSDLDRLSNKLQDVEDNHIKIVESRKAASLELENLKKKKGAYALVAERETMQMQCLENTREFAQLTLAKIVLEKAIESYRDTNQDPILISACAFLKTLTNGSFIGFDPEDINGKKTLTLERAGSTKGISFNSNNLTFEEGSTFLSDGTADQLFLALRLAGIENNLAKLEEPLPVILDDILINFDDARALSTLRCLAEFSSKTQVILFTHHKHLLKLVAGSDFADKVFTHQLG